MKAHYFCIRIRGPGEVHIAYYVDPSKVLYAPIRGGSVPRPRAPILNLFASACPCVLVGWISAVRICCTEFLYD